MSSSFFKTKRLHTANDFSCVFKKQTKKAHHKNLLAIAKPNERTKPRLGLAIAKKHCKKAVDRNRIKRIIRECFRQSVLPTYDIVFVSKPGIALKTKTQLHQMTTELLSKLA